MSFIQIISVGFAQSLHFLAIEHVFLLCPHPGPLYSRSNLLTTNDVPIIFFPLSHIFGTISWIACLSVTPSFMKPNTWVEWMLSYGYDHSDEKGNIVIALHIRQSYYKNTLNTLNTLNRYFGQKTMWYLHSYNVCDKFLNFLRTMYIAVIFKQLPGRYIINN